ncbi:MAG: hypothetical protein KAT57_02615, partial [Candidatus Lokiarchaeota archaeon]|nr:hypothetical protein [Candidatus Lokiarchaeota archaeon]
LLPEYNTTQNQKESKSVPSIIVSNPLFHQNNMSTYETSITALARLIVENKFDIKRFCIQFRDTWDTFNEDVLLTTISTNTKQERNILLMNLVKDKIALFAPLHSSIEWKKFGYNYFNPEDRAFFASVFKQNYLATDVTKTLETFSHIYT